MSIVTWSIINNEIDFIKEIIEYHLSFVDGMYILETGSTDGTLEYLKNLNHPKVVVEEYPIKYSTEYHLAWEEMKQPFPERDVRNYAINRAREAFKPDWLIQLDGDEVFLAETKKIIDKVNPCLSISHSTLNPVGDPTTHRKEFRKGYHLYDPHCRIWNCQYQIEYILNPAFHGKKQYHCIPSLAERGRHIFHEYGNLFVPDNIHFHLHWLYGRKLDSFFPGRSRSEIAALLPVNEFFDLLPEPFQNKRKEYER